MAIFGAFEKKNKATLFSGVSGFLSTVFGVSHDRPGGPATIEESLDVSVVFAAARVVAEGVAQMPLRLIEEDRAGNTRRTGMGCRAGRTGRYGLGDPSGL